MAVGEQILGVVFCLVGGVLNSTWPLFTNLKAPRIIRICTEEGWHFENVWLVFSVAFAGLNAVYCIGVLGFDIIRENYREASTLDFSLLCCFSFAWGLGTLGFSLAVALLGAVGNALVMSLLVVIGTLLPLIVDDLDEVTSAASLTTLFGVALAVLGFTSSAYSSWLRDSARLRAKSLDHESSPSFAARSALVQQQEEGEPYTSCVASVDALDRGDGLQQDETKSPSPHTGKSNFLVGLLVSVVAAVASSMLQAAFVFGGPLIDYAEEEQGEKEVWSSLVVWLMAFSLCGLFNIIYAAYLLSTRGTWNRYKAVYMGRRGSLKTKLMVFQTSIMASFFVAHIHFYGVAQFLFGDLGSVIAWPLIMSSTVLSGQVWGIVYFKELKHAGNRAKRVNVLAIALLLTAVTVIAIAGIVL